VLTIRTSTVLMKWNSGWFSSGAILSRTLSLRLGVKSVKHLFVRAKKTVIWARRMNSLTVTVYELFWVTGLQKILCIFLQKCEKRLFTAQILLGRATTRLRWGGIFYMRWWKNGQNQSTETKDITRIKVAQFFWFTVYTTSCAHGDTICDIRYPRPVLGTI